MVLNLGYWQMQQIEITEFMFTEDLIIVAESDRILYCNLRILKAGLKKVNIKINTE